MKYVLHENIRKVDYKYIYTYTKYYLKVCKYNSVVR